MKWVRIGIVLLIPLFFFVLSAATIYDYGVNWDSLQHLVRGQIYYRYLTTGEKNAVDVPDICRNAEGSASTVDAKTGRICDKNHAPRTSFYEKIDLDFAWTQKMTIGHPPITDILLAGSNQLFYKTLGWFEDIQGYHLYIVFITFLMAVIVAVWAYQTYGLFASLISVISLYTYPLLFSEQHFNLKDPAVAAYFTGTLYFLWLGIAKKKVVPLIGAGLFAGLSLGTKFNILFAVPVVFVWLSYLILREAKGGSFNTIRVGFMRVMRPSMVMALAGIPVIAFILFFVSYPALWSSPVQGVLSVIAYYRDIGGSRCYYYPFTGLWFLKCTDFHTLRLYGTTLPVMTVILSGVGFLFAWKRLGERFAAPLLWALWLLVTIGRATLPIGSLYGGSLRQIMEFAPAAALLSGFGAVLVRNEILSRLRPRVRRMFGIRVGISLAVLLCYIPVGVAMVRLHPNENLYYNILAGGLNGAVAKGFPVATNTYGNGYKQAIDWVNRNVPEDSNVYLAEGISSAVPSIMFRPDIHYKGSSPLIRHHDGGYIIEINEPGMSIDMYHNMRILHSFLRPVHEITVDGVAIVYIWKNDSSYAEGIPSFESEYFMGEIKVIPLKADEVVLDLGVPAIVKRIDLKTSDGQCSSAVDQLIPFISDDGIHFTRILENTYRTSNETVSLSIGAAARYIKLYSYKTTKCNLSTVNYSGIAY